MNGYVKNISPEWVYAMKRAIRPGGEVPLDELYEQYGKKYNMEPDDEFINWLTNVKLKNVNKWKIVFDTNAKSEAVEKEKEGNKKTSNSSVTPMVSKGMQVEDIVNLTVRKAREELPKITDLNLLKYSLQEANQLSNKDSLCRIIRKRIKELQISR
jgi:hypothetical protein